MPATRTHVLHVLLTSCGAGHDRWMRLRDVDALSAAAELAGGRRRPNDQPVHVLRPARLLRHTDADDAPFAADRTARRVGCPR